jgi:hypothetical protein
MCRKCLAHATRQLMYALCTLPSEERGHGIIFVMEITKDLMDLDFDFDALEAKMKLEQQEVAGHG